MLVLTRRCHYLPPSYSMIPHLVYQRVHASLLHPTLSALTGAVLSYMDCRYIDSMYTSLQKLILPYLISSTDEHKLLIFGKRSKSTRQIRNVQEDSF